MAKSTSELREYWTEVFQSHFKIKREDAKVLFLTCSHFLKDTHLSEPVILRKIKAGDIPGIQGETIRDWVIRILNPRNESKTLERRLRRLEEAVELSFKERQEIVFDVIDNYETITGFELRDVIDLNGRWNNRNLSLAERKIKSYLVNEFSLELDEIATILYRVNKVIRENYEKYQ